MVLQMRLSASQNRDRLELYAWHKQAIAGDAPTTAQASISAAEKAKYMAWRGKSGTDKQQAMSNYIQESERQVRVYGYSSGAQLPSSISTAPALEDGSSSTPREPAQPSRGLAAIPLLCAAASEQRPAYLRRLQNTPITSAWWRRQEPLTATPGSLPAIPESILLWVASLVEHISLAANDKLLGQSIPTALAAVLQSALWPIHNALLSVWMGWILMAAVMSGALELAKTVLLGSRRTGRTLESVWTDDVVFASTAVHTLTEAHQPVSARVVGLLLQPLPVLTHVLSGLPPLWMAAAYTVAVVMTWWYWMMLVPWCLVVVMLGTSVGLGGCFGLIELASQI